MNRLKGYFGSVENAANFLSIYFSIESDFFGACFRCPMREICKNKQDADCEELIAEWLEEEI